MKIVIFQGNYPADYAKTRHNVGFMFADFLVKKFGASFIQKPKFKAEIAEIFLNQERVLFVKPQTFYNETGFSARSICDFYKVDWRMDLLVVHDDLDLNFGVVRTRSSGSSAGNNGLKSLISYLSQDFCRIKIGIRNDFLNNFNHADFVLAKFSKSEVEKLPKIFEICEIFFEKFLQNDFQNTKKTV